jgi:formylglycine-generating enzyme required for sulfatase activity
MDADAKEIRLRAAPATVESATAEMVRIETGPFQAGIDGMPNYPAREEAIEAAYWIDRYEVTNFEFAEFLEATGRSAVFEHLEAVDMARYGNRPAMSVTWKESVAYAEWVGKRLPTSQEWERAARGTDGRIYPWGNEPSDPRLVKERASIGRATLEEMQQSGLETPLRRGSPVGSHPMDMSPDGVFDVLGSAMEFVEDRPIVWNDSVLVVSDRERMFRGHSWKWPTDYVNLGIYGTMPASQSGFSNGVGFRCAKSATPVKEAQ